MVIFQPRWGYVFMGDFYYIFSTGRKIKGIYIIKLEVNMKF